MDKKFIIISILLVFIVSNLVVAQEDPDAWISDPYFFIADPDVAFSTNYDKAWETIANNPELLDDPFVFEEALAASLERAAVAVNQRPQTLQNKENVEVFDQAVREEGVAVVNNNPEAKKSWLENKHNVEMEDANTKIKAYDGEKLTTEVPPNSFQNNVFGGEGVVTLENYKDGFLEINGDGGIVYTIGKIPTTEEEASLPFSNLPGPIDLNVPPSDVVTVDTGDQTVDTVGGNKFKGKIHFNKGRAHVWGSPLELNDVIIDPQEPEEVVDIYFDGKTHTGNYVSMDHSEGKMSFGRDTAKPDSLETYNLIFKPGNPFLGSKPKELFIVNNVYSDTDVNIENRGPDTIPLVTVQQRNNPRDFTSGMSFINGNQFFKVDQNRGVTYEGFEKIPIDSVPFSLVMKDRHNKNVINKEGPPQKVVFDNQQNFIFVNEDADEYDVADSQVVFNDLKTQLEVESPAIVFDFVSERNLPNILDNLRALPPGFKDGIDEIRVVSPDQVVDLCSGEANTVACFNRPMRRFTIPDDVDGEIFYHETIHSKINLFADETLLKTDAFKDWREHQLAMIDKYGVELGKVKLEDLSKEQQVELIDDTIENSRLVKKASSNLKLVSVPQDRWSKIAATDKGEPVYSVDLVDSVVDETSFSNPVLYEETKESLVIKLNEDRIVKWAGEPALGCFNWYSCTEYEEDRANTAAYAANRPATFFLPYITPPGQEGYDSVKYDKRYRLKLDYSHELGDITDDVYHSIVDPVDKTVAVASK